MSFLVEIGVFLILCSGLWGSTGVKKQSRWHYHLNIFCQHGEKTGNFLLMNLQNM